MSAFPPPQVPNPARMDPSEMRRQLMADPNHGRELGRGAVGARATRRSGLIVALIGVVAAVAIRVLG